MKASIHFYSATGNTARAVQALAAGLEAAGHEVARIPVDGRRPPARDIPDLTIIAFPIWAWAAPHFMLDHARRLPKAKAARAAVLATCGGFGAQGVGEMARVLRRRGYQVVASGEARYPDNWILAQSPPQGEKLAQALTRGDEQVAGFAAKLLSGRPAMLHCALRHQLWSWPIAVLFRTFGRRFLGKAFIADDPCASCGLCAATCPVQAIQMAGQPARPRWNASCAACYRCINLCPAKAIQVSVPLLGIHLGLNLMLTIVFLSIIGWFHRVLIPELYFICPFLISVSWELEK